MVPATTSTRRAVLTWADARTAWSKRLEAPQFQEAKRRIDGDRCASALPCKSNRSQYRCLPHWRDSTVPLHTKDCDHNTNLQRKRAATTVQTLETRKTLRVRCERRIKSTSAQPHVLTTGDGDVPSIASDIKNRLPREPLWSELKRSHPLISEVLWYSCCGCAGSRQQAWKPANTREKQKEASNLYKNLMGAIQRVCL